VYRGRVTVPGEEPFGKEVAVKIMHPGVRDYIDADYDLLRLLAKVRIAL
jgi:predicted unusual protein kinase regulating ubiquinone biosynthesis (AarF/ABC1/UbiB family)